MEQSINITPIGPDVNYRTGDLPKPFTPHNIEYKGNIEAPFAFFSARNEGEVIYTSNDNFGLSETILIVNHKENTLTLICGENRQEKITVVGSLKLDDSVQDIGINKPAIRRSVSELRDFIKYNRQHLHSECSFQETLKALQKVSIAFTTKKTVEKDGTGNSLDSNQQIVDDLPKLNIIFNIRLFEGMPKEKIPVNVEAEVVGGELKFLFFSEELATLIENIAESSIAIQVEAFESKIAIIHQ